MLYPMESEEITVKLPAATFAALCEIARSEDMTLGDLLREAVRRDIARRRAENPHNRANERLVATTQQALARDMADAQSWGDLQDRLWRKGFRLVEAGGCLILLRHPSGERVCRGSELGFSAAQLARRFNAAFPAHAQGPHAAPSTARSCH